MSFSEAYLYMLKGFKIKRPCFRGYWYINGVTGALTIHMGDGSEITESDNLTLTIHNVLAEDWVVTDDDKQIGFTAGY